MRRRGRNQHSGSAQEPNRNDGAESSFIHHVDNKWTLNPDWEDRWSRFCRETINECARAPRRPRRRSQPYIGTLRSQARDTPPSKLRKVDDAREPAEIKVKGPMARYLTGKGPLVVSQLFRILTLDVSKAVLSPRSSDSSAVVAPSQGVYKTFSVVTVQSESWFSTERAGSILGELISRIENRPPVPKTDKNNPLAKGNTEKTVRWVTWPAVKPLATLPGGMPMLQRVENGRETILQSVFGQVTGQSLRRLIQDGLNREAVIVGIDPGTLCPIAISARLFDRNEQAMQDDLVLYASSIDESLKATPRQYSNDQCDPRCQAQVWAQYEPDCCLPPPPPGRGCPGGTTAPPRPDPKSRTADLQQNG
ncbi:BQ2448_3221 [Microbotryum intermedium]|uniref:BQ2448_3221 protein n=1 Tax=Microbotryum intermedium TaxID=269621 RepID=A0A238FI07_9BASI|nr:BQ2448_3221 [Microbotryum intermedium]